MSSAAAVSAPSHADEQCPKNESGDDDEHETAGAATGGASAKMSKAAKRRMKEKMKRQEALAAALSSLDAGVTLENATKEQMATATALLAAARDTSAAASVDASYTVELAPGDIRSDPADGNIYPLVPKGHKRQTFPEPTIPVRDQFGPRDFPAGQILMHALDHNTSRISSAEKRALDRVQDDMVQDLRHAAEVHRQVRRWAQSWITPGLPLITICDRIEKKLEELICKDGLKAGQAFPTGINPNFIAAHYTPNTGDGRLLEENDVIKIDFGTHINGRIIDCAWTWAKNPRYDPLLNAVRAATNEGIKQAGIDVRLGDIGAAIQEVMESYEVEIDKKVYRVKSIRNLSGHTIDAYRIHAGKSVPIVKSHDATKMEEGELYAIETFGSTGRGQIIEDLECSHYMATAGAKAAAASLRSDKAKQLMAHIDKHYSTLAFCRKWLDRGGADRHLMALNQLCDAGCIDRYPPLCDTKNSYTAQYEHTILLRPTCKEVLSRGNDY